MRSAISRPDPIEHVTRMKSRYSGLQGWKLTGRMIAAPRQPAEKIDGRRADTQPGRRETDEILVGMLR